MSFKSSQCSVYNNIEFSKIETSKENIRMESKPLSLTAKLVILASLLSILATALTVSLIVVIVSTKDEKSNTNCLKNECILSAGYLSSSMDLSAKPCDDFYKYVCGKWQEDHPYPAYAEGWSHFYKLSYEIRTELRKLLENKTLSDSKPKAIGKLYNFYHGCINQTSRDSIGYSPLLDVIEDIGGWPTINSSWMSDDYEWEETFIKLVKIKLFPLLKIQVIKDLKNTSRTIISIGPQYSSEEDLTAIYKTQKVENVDYFSDSNNGKLIKSLIKELISSNTSEAQINKDIEAIFTFKLELQKSVSPINSAVYYQKNYDSHIMQIKDLPKNFKGIQFIKILKSIFTDTITEEDVVFIPDMNYVQKLGLIINATDKKTIANFFATSLVLSFGQYTTTRMVELLVEKLDAPEILPNICFNIVEKLLPNLLGRLYIDHHFNKNSLKDMQYLISLLHESFYQLLDESNWMDSNTKQEAKNKLDFMSQNVAYPNWTMDDNMLEQYYDPYINISTENFFSSVLRIHEAKQSQNFLELSEKFAPENSSIWPSHSAIDVNAFYYFSTNGIYFPAGIAQYPFYLYGRPMAMNLGSIGMIIGHEMTHSMDKTGSLYDSRGDLRNWWTNSTRELFLNKSNCFVNQYKEFYFAEQNLTVNGVRTLSENIADNGGVREAYRALQLYKSRRNSTEQFQSLPGIMSQFNEEQLFFISFANMWCSNMNPDAIKDSLLKGVHSPESARVKGSLANFDKFAEAFNCSVGTKMNSENKCILW